VLDDGLTMSSLAQHMRDTVWQRRGVGGRLAWLLLLPASVLFAVGGSRAACVSACGASIARIAVVSVGNLSVGGQQTPVSLWLARQLDYRGRHVAFCCANLRPCRRRHNGRAGRTSSTSTADEDVMLARCFDGIVLTSRRRIDGVAATEQLGCDASCSTSTQHWALARDVDLV
jgi:tetraacyldisaccharide-1-P 4'-kinase